MRCDSSPALSILVRTKTLAGERILPLTPWVAGALTAWREQAPENPWGLLFTTATGQPVSRHSYRRSWIALQRPRAFKNQTVHCMSLTKPATRLPLDDQGPYTVITAFFEDEG